MESSSELSRIYQLRIVLRVAFSIHQVFGLGDVHQNFQAIVTLIAPDAESGA